MSREAEVRYGESREQAVLERWRSLSERARGCHTFVRSKDLMTDYAPIDFLGFDKDLVPMTYVEIKVRRSKWGKWGDVMFPYLKHEMARKLAAAGIGLLGVTAYSCGTIVEIDLARTPSSVKLVGRRDRPGTPPSKHGFWKGQALRLFPSTGGWCP